MSSTMPAVGIPFNTLYPSQTEEIIFRKSKTNEDETSNLIVIDDIKDLSEATTVDTIKIPYFYATVGITPTPAIKDNLALKISLSLLLASIMSVWVPNAYLLGVFAILSLINFLTSLAWDTSGDYRVKISRLVADFLLVGISGTFAELMLGKIQIPFTSINISILSIVLYLMIFSYLSILAKRLLPLTSITQSKIVLNLILACKRGLEAGKEDFDKRQEKEILTGKKRKK